MTRDEIVGKASAAAFGHRLITNVLRAIVVEAIVSDALSEDWTWCSADYAPFDFRHRDGTGLEVKQSAALQSWAELTGRVSKSQFDIAPRTGHYEGATWFPGGGRAAKIYVFAHHPIVDGTADHADPTQWIFYVVSTELLPASRSISLTPIRNLVEGLSVPELDAAVAKVHQSIAQSPIGYGL